MTQIINLFAGPGAGKSTTAAGLFHLLKLRGFSCELVHEFAKDLTWRERYNTLGVQPYVFGKQLERIEALNGKVKYIITDSPILLSVIYAEDKWPASFKQSVIDIFKRYDSLNYFLTRSKDYIQVGRTQTLAQAQLIDNRILELLLQARITYSTIQGSADAPHEIMKALAVCVLHQKGTS